MGQVLHGSATTRFSSSTLKEYAPYLFSNVTQLIAALKNCHGISRRATILLYRLKERRLSGLPGTLATQVYGVRFRLTLAHLTAWCERKAAPYLGVPVATIKRHATGKGNAPKGDVIRAVRAQGFLPKDDNEADALALLAWAIANEIGGAQ